MGDLCAGPDADDKNRSKTCVVDDNGGLRAVDDLDRQSPADGVGKATRLHTALPVNVNIMEPPKRPTCSR
eukprot:6974867-Lingulodinium_polyedra.AAC.1